MQMKQAENDLLQHKEFIQIEQYSTFWSNYNAPEVVYLNHGDI